MTFRASYWARRELGAPRRRAARYAWHAVRDRRALARRNKFAGPGDATLSPRSASPRSLGPAFDLQYRGDRGGR